MNAPATLIICEHCDSVYRRKPLRRGEKACCQLCGAVLYRWQCLSVEMVLALALTGLVLLVFANSWPVIAIGMQGIQSSVTLWGAIYACWQQGARFVSVLLGFTLFVAPLLQCLALAWMCGFAFSGRRAPAQGKLSRLLHTLHPWSMVEVWLLGVFVAIVKLYSMFDVNWEAGLWSFAGLMLVMTLLASWDISQLWDAVPESPL